MPKKKYKKTSTGISWRETIAILSSITGLISSIVAWLDIVQYGQMGYQNFLWAGIAAAVVIWGIILWLLYKQRNISFSIGLAITMVAVAVVGIWWTSNNKTEEERIKARERNLIVLIAKFDDTNNDYYELRDEIYNTLKANFANDSSVQIEKLDETITEDAASGSPRARDLGKNYQADLVIWGSYRKTENPNMKIHIENMSLKQIEIVSEGETLRPLITLEELESFAFQQQAGQETSALIWFLAGIIDLDAENYKSSISHFDNALENLSTQPNLLENLDEIYSYRATTNLLLKKYQIAIQDYSKSIDMNPNNTFGYVNRGISYLFIKNYDRAIQDFNKAIELDLNDAVAYENRGNAYFALQDYERAVQDFNKAVELGSNNAITYYNLGNVYSALQDYEHAIQDYGHAIELDPSFAAAYFNRGNAYLDLQNYKLALQDYDQAIELIPNFASVYFNRGIVYSSLQDYSHSIQDYSKTIELNPNHVNAYYYRGLDYLAIGKIAEAEADFAKYKELTGQDIP